MLKAYSAILRRFLIVADLVIIAAAFSLVYSLSNISGHFDHIGIFWQILLLELVVWGFALNILGANKSFRIKNFNELYGIFFKGAFISLFISAAIFYFLKVPKEGRDFLAWASLLSIVFLCGYKTLLLMFFHSLRKGGFNYRNILIVGTGKRAQTFIDLVERNSEWGLKIIGIVDAEKGLVGSFIKKIPVIGSFDDIPRIIHSMVVDEIVFVVPRSLLNKISHIITFCETEGVVASIALDLFDLKIAKCRQVDLHGFPLVVFETTTDRYFHLVLKRMFDIAVSFIGILILSPFLLLISLLIKLTSKGPVLFKQMRKGLHGRVFTLYKFRTMTHDAEAKLKDLANLNEMTGPVFKITNDPRITPLGRFLRKSSIDELPQLWNILMGHMSVIGPRPPLTTEVDLYEDWQRRRLSMRPGLTCIWQVSGRNKIADFKKWVELDLHYIDNWSLLLDFKIFFKTIPVVLFGIGSR